MHCISHHLYPNLELDYEAASFEPIAYYLRTKPENNPYIEIILQFIYFFIQPINMTLKIVIVPILKKKMPDLWYGVPFLVFLFFYLFNGSIWQSLKLYLCLYGLFGIIFGRVLFCGHKLQELWTEGS